MRRRRRSFDAAGASNPFEDASEDVNPNSYLTNLADCMLVLSVGFMVALVAAYNVDLPSVSEVQQQNMTEVSDVQKMVDEMSSSGSSYNKLGEVYQDPTTGKMYMLENAGKSSSSSSDKSSKSSKSDSSGS